MKTILSAEFGFTRLSTTAENIKEWRAKFPVLKHVRTGEDLRGLMYIDHDNLVAVLQCDVVSGYIALEVTPKYKRLGLATHLLQVAQNEFGCYALSVNKKNEIAQRLYLKNGYTVFKEDKNMLYMRKPTPNQLRNAKYGKV